ncbi:hypothetical protein FGG08_007267 [Glutinoglossum americanum]|uniref:BZIP domain-containing protein n=1 Tax=Glutinoglossum americanum TaxID=1670608 RepID=A0A9P8I1U5_9PEZI|nr:hypothetical protein FGG08_007267 [Glutinoglossum americanum]
MSAFIGRRAPNVSQYIATLNTIPSAHDLASQQQQDSFGLEDDLALFTNTQFFDFDMGESHALVEYDPEHELRARRENAAAHKHGMKDLDFLGGDYQFSDFSEFPNALGDSTSGGIQTLDHPPPNLSSPIANTPPSDFTSNTSGDKRKADSIVDPNQVPSLEGASRIAAEEDKRRRNTAASARFRVKKKQREQALERTAKEMTDKCSRLEARIGQLEMENKWLKNLITEKNENKDDIAELWRKFNRDSNSESRRAPDRKDGVGTLKKAEID